MLNVVINSKRQAGAPFPAENGEYSAPRCWLQHYVDRGRQEALPFAVLGWLTPVLAELLLTRNANNRALSKTKLASYARDIADGNFELNGETIIISSDGLLNDGQHRCQAVVSAGKAIKTFFVFGVKRETRATVDQGKARTAGDILAFDGVLEANTAAAVASLIHQYLDSGSISRQHADRPTRQQLRDLFNQDDNEQISASLDVVGRVGTPALGGRSVLAFCHFVIKSACPQYADYFIKKLITGDELREDDPIFKCRARLLNSRRLRVNEKAELIFRAWNAFREGRPIKTIPILGTLPEVRA